MFYLLYVTSTLSEVSEHDLLSKEGKQISSDIRETLQMGADVLPTHPSPFISEETLEQSFLLWPSLKTTPTIQTLVSEKKMP